MIFDLMLYCAGALLRIFAGMIGGFISFTIPNWWHDILTTSFSYLSYLQGYVPFYPDPTIESGLARTIGLMTIVNTVILFFIAWFTFKLIIKWAPLPHWLRFGFGNDINTEPLDLRPADRGTGRVVDLRRGKRSSRKYLRDIH